MSHDRQRLIEEIFVAAAGAPPDARAALLESRCGTDADLRSEVESLLIAHEDSDKKILDHPQPMTMGLMQQISGLLRADDATLPPGNKVGAYIVHRVIGSGGMGVVYLAEQERPRRTVALKVIRRGLATPSLLRRFEHEAEILGRLHHAGIAQIYEAGVADYGSGPQPFIAMEYIDGRPLTEYVESRALGTRERLALMVRVCDAVQHAHQRGVIHRDLKPANILVEPEEKTTTTSGTKHESTGTALFAGVGQPKILDFGVARMADEPHRATTLQTNVGQLIGTLPYMSPEQLGVDAGDIDTRSDVYGLGVVLYQLLTGRLPYDVSSRALPEAVRMIRDDTPTRLSSINKTFRGDLETIVSKAIEKDRSRRYQSAAELGADIQRFLMDEPIAAKRDSAMYLLRKQLSRYRGAVAAAALILLCLVVFAIYAVIFAEKEHAAQVEATDAKKDAMGARDRADQVAARLKEELVASHIERSRLEAFLGNTTLAEDLLWPEYLRSVASPTGSSTGAMGDSSSASGINSDDSNSEYARWALWELYNRAPCLWTVQGTQGYARCLAAAPDGKTFAIGDNRNFLTIFSSATGAQLNQRGPFSAQVMSAAYLPSGDAILVGLLDGRVAIAAADTKEPPRFLNDGKPIHTGGTLAVACSRVDGLLATAGDDRKIRLWSTDDLSTKREWVAHDGPIISLAFSANGKVLASGARIDDQDGTAKAWRVSDGQLLDDNLNSGETHAIALSSDGTWAVAGGRTRAVHVGQVGTDLRKVPGANFRFTVTAAGFSPNERTIFAAGGVTIEAWSRREDGVSERPFVTLGTHANYIVAAAWLEPDRIVSVSFDGVIKAWEPTRTPAMRGVGGFDGWVFDTQYSPDGSRLAISCSDGTLVIADGLTRKRIHTITLSPTKYRTRCLCFTPDGLLIAGSQDGQIRLIDPQTGETIDQFGKGVYEVYSLSLDAAHGILAAGYGDGYIRLWNLPTRTMLWESPRQLRRIEGIAISPDGATIAAGGLESGVQLWDVATRKPLEKLEGAGQPWSILFSPDGSQVVAGTWSAALDVWDFRTRTRIASVQAHASLIAGLAFRADGKYLLSGCDDGTVKLWDAHAWRVLLTLETSHGEASSVAFHPGGRWICAGCRQSMAPIWDLAAIDKHIAGNLEYQIGRHKDKIENIGSLAPLIEESRKLRGITATNEPRP